MKPIITLKNVSVRYDNGKSNETVALKDVSLEINKGEYVVFLGPSGCGKSTLLYTIAGLESATGGEVSVAGKNLRLLDGSDRVKFYRETIGMIFQAFYLIPHLSAHDNIVLAEMFSGMPVAGREQKVIELMNKFGIASFADNRPAMMSGGQQQRTAIARALINDPEIILADEPVGNLDSKNAGIVLELLARIHRDEQKTIIQVTHNPQDTKYANRVFYMKDGVIEHIVTNTEIVTMSSDLSDTQRQARHIVRHLLFPYDLDTEQRIEDIVAQYLRKEISKERMTKYLDDRATGAGLYAQKARWLSDRVEEIGHEMDETAAAHQSPLSTDLLLENEAKVIRKRLLDRYTGHLSPEVIQQLDTAIASRLANRLTTEEFAEILDRPAQDGGLGLNRRTAKHFTEEVELVCSKHTI